MGSAMSADWWRAYRQRRGESLRAYSRARRQQPKLRAQRRAAEERRRARLRFDPPDVVIDHPLLQQAALLVPYDGFGTFYRFASELLVEDLRSEAVLALLEGRCPVAAIREYRRVESEWSHRIAPLIEGGNDDADLVF